MAGLQEAASRPPENSVFSADREETAEIRIPPGAASGVNIATLQLQPRIRLLLRNVLTCGMSYGPECHVDNVAWVRIAHCGDKADNDKYDLRTVQTPNGGSTAGEIM